MTTDEDDGISARDFRGNEVRCDSCVHRDLLAQKRCQLQRACVHDRYARRIDRFFDWNPALADDYLTHPHFEVRAIAAKSASVFRLSSLLRDPDETVRWNAVRRLPARYLLGLRGDPHREVRIRVASLLNQADLVPMLRDPDYYVRVVVARRLPAALLVLMIEDPEPEVRRIVASRIPEDWLSRIAMDRDGSVRLEAARRLSPERLGGLINDADWRVRYHVASRVEAAALAALQDDPDPLVRDLARSRFDGMQKVQRGDVVAFGSGEGKES